MTVWIDDARHPLGRMVMGHMLADTLDELHDMAAAIGMRRAWYQPTSFPHYDVSLQRRDAAARLGAVRCDRRGIVAVKRRLRTCPAFIASVVRIHAADGIARPGWATIDHQIGGTSA